MVDILLDALPRSRLHICPSTDHVTVLLLVAQWYRALVDALAVLKTRKET
jgi:hypothetical protein